MNFLFKISTATLLITVFFLLPGCEKKEKKSNAAILTITSKPEKAEIEIKGEKLGVTPLKLKLASGKYIIKASKKKFQPEWRKILCAPGQKKETELELKPVTAPVLIESKPPKAEVVLNGEVYGETPLVIYNQPIGKHTAILKKLGYVNKEISWEITSPRPAHVTAGLTSNLGILEIVSSPSKATLEIDGNKRGYTPFKADIEQGRHKIKLSKGDYTVYEGIVTVPRNKKISKKITLQLLPGILSVKSKPEGAVLFINNKKQGTAPVEIKNLKPGSYRLKLIKSGYDPVERQVTIHAGRKTSISVNLDSNTGRIHLVTTPPGISIYLDGKFMGKTVKGEHKGISNIFVMNDVSMGTHTLTLAHKRAVPNKKSFKVRIKKGGTKRLENLKMWIADTVLFLRDGTKHIGRLAKENRDEIMFEIEPGVTQHYERREIKKLMPLKYKEE